MPYEFYKILHIVGLTGVVIALASTVAYARAQSEVARKQLGITHGVSLLIMFVSGFGLVAKIQSGFAPWVIAKIVLWFALGGYLVLARKKPTLPVLSGLVALVAIGVALAVTKPF